MLVMEGIDDRGSICNLGILRNTSRNCELNPSSSLDNLTFTFVRV